jgi:hypothetical protein
MQDKRPSSTETRWCSDGNKIGDLHMGKSLALVPCKKEACERYREDYPYCIQMVRVGKNGRI